MIDAIGGVVAVDDAIAIAVSGDSAGYGAWRRWGRWRWGRGFFLPRARSERQRGNAGQKD